MDLQEFPKMARPSREVIVTDRFPAFYETRLLARQVLMQHDATDAQVAEACAVLERSTDLDDRLMARDRRVFLTARGVDPLDGMATHFADTNEADPLGDRLLFWAVIACIPVGVAAIALQLMGGR